MDYSGTCHAVREIELLARLLVREGYAELVKDAHDGNRNVSIRKYRILVGNEYEVNARFWYNQSLDKAIFKITDEGIDAILQSGTVVVGLLNIGKTINKNGHGFNMSDLADAVKEGLTHLQAQKIIDETEAKAILEGKK
jgi:hypothetical protein